MNNVKTTSQWLKEFKKNEKKVYRVPFDCYELEESEKRRITHSIQSFQLGESSSGNNLKRFARAYALKFNSPEYVELMNLFIKEENRHSSYLWHFMRQHNIPKAQTRTTDSCFRFFRSLLGIELSLRVLITAELIALSYYQALGRATQSRVLFDLCEHMLAEERSHVRFQMQHIQNINLRKNTFFANICDLAHLIFFIITMLVVWVEHSPVLSHQMGLKRFLKQAFNHFTTTLEQGQIDVMEINVGELRPKKEFLCI